MFTSSLVHLHGKLNVGSIYEEVPDGAAWSKRRKEALEGLKGQGGRRRWKGASGNQKDQLGHQPRLRTYTNLTWAQLKGAEWFQLSRATLSMGKIASSTTTQLLLVHGAGHLCSGLSVSEVPVGQLMCNKDMGLGKACWTCRKGWDRFKDLNPPRHLSMQGDETTKVVTTRENHRWPKKRRSRSVWKKD